MPLSALRTFAATLALLAPLALDAQVLRLDAVATDPLHRMTAIGRLATATLARASTASTVRATIDRALLLVAVGATDAALATIDSLRARPDFPAPRQEISFSTLVIHAHATRDVVRRQLLYPQAYRLAFRAEMGRMGDRDAYEVTWALETPLPAIAGAFDAAVARATSADSLSVDEAIALVRLAERHRAAHASADVLTELIAEDVARRYVTDTAVFIRTPDGATLSALTVRPRNARGPQPTTLEFDIYVDVPGYTERARYAASYGYVGMVADARGKRLSRDVIRPYETEVDDTHAVLDWIAAQPWSDGRVGMHGASYGGFASWAATKRKHPALRTLVAHAAAIPGFGLPMENNVFLLANYAWPFFVTNNRTLDDAVNNDRARWDSMSTRWYTSGRAYRSVDSLDGTPNHWLQRWLQHPSFDAYWQAMVPFGKDFRAIDIPVLTVTGYFDDGQISALEYAREHLRQRPGAEHYVVIGPYEHLSVSALRKPTMVRGYAIDPVAQLNSRELTFGWFDHVLRGAPRPSLLKDRINYQVMGANTWRHAPSFEALGSERLRLHLSSEREGADYRLEATRPARGTGVERVANLADRTTEHTGYYALEVTRTDRDFGGALTFVSEPFADPVELSGSLTGELEVTVNARDFDFNLVLYELLPDGRLVHLMYVLQRASYARDMTRRQLLRPGVVSRLPFKRARMTGRKLAPGSRLLLVVDVNKDAYHQVNHGTGRDVSDETASDAAEPVRVRVLPGSWVDLQIRR
jgi:uncharacterized protein